MSTSELSDEALPRPMIQEPQPAAVMPLPAVTPLRVLVFQEDQLFGSALTAELEASSWSVRNYAEGPAFLAALDEAGDAEVILLEWREPKTRGVDLFSAVRRHGVKLPVVFLADRNLIHHEIQAFQRGAADFFHKSRGVGILAQRLRAAVAASRCANHPREGRTMFGGRLTLYERVSRASWNGADLDLTLGEYNISELLALNAGSYVPYRTLHHELCKLRGPMRLTDKDCRANVRSAMKRMRKKFRFLEPSFSEIESFTAFGYRWRAPPAEEEVPKNLSVWPAERLWSDN
jgi:two-component system response regulator ChvI